MQGIRLGTIKRIKGLEFGLWPLPVRTRMIP
jgi:hypothetical protein